MQPLPTPPSSGPSARSRRTDPSSSSEDGFRRSFGISNVKYRVGAPPLRPLPLQISQSNPILDAQPPFSDAGGLENELIATAYEILRTYNVLRPWSEVETDDDPYDDRVSLVTRFVPEEPEIREPTLFIVAPWNDTSGELWERVVKHIKRAVNDRMEANGRADLDITVEIIAPELVMETYIGLISDQPRLEAAWPALGQRIFLILESFASTKSHMTSISLIRLGYNVDDAQNPVTVYISVRYESHETGWPPVVNKIKTYLRENNWPNINVHMEHNVPNQSTFQLNPPAPKTKDIESIGYETFTINEDYRESVNMGADIGACTYLKRKEDGKVCNPLIGTLGCYIQVKTKSNQQSWTTYALTCHHVVRPCSTGFVVEKSPKSQASIIGAPLPGSLLETFDLQGRSPQNLNDDDGLESPSRLKHNATVQNLKDSMANGNNAVKPELEQKLLFFDRGRQVLGKVWCSSGYARRTSAGNRLDWALVSVNTNRLGMNMLPSYSTWDSKYLAPWHPHGSAFSITLKPPGPTSMKAQLKDVNVFKLGAASGVTSGHFSHLKFAVSIAEDSYMVDNKSDAAKNWMSWEYVYKGNVSRGGTSPLGLKGDSGAVVFDKYGAALGLLFTGLQPQRNRQGLTYVTPIEDVFNDIKLFSGKRITEIRIP